MRKSFALLLVLILTVSSLIVVELARASITKPSIPEFSVKLVDHSYDVPTSYSIDPYTGENVTQPSYHVDNRTIEVTIKNQPFASYYNESMGGSGRVDFFYDIRVKGHYSEDWIELYRPSDGYPYQDSESQYTKKSYVLYGRGNDTEMGTKLINFPAGAQVDFQVEAMIGCIWRSGGVPFCAYEFHGETSGWSNTQTITIGTNSVPSDTTEPPPSQQPTNTSGQQNGFLGSNLPMEYGYAIVTVTAVAIGAVAFLAYFRRIRKTTGKANQVKEGTNNTS